MYLELSCKRIRWPRSSAVLSSSISDLVLLILFFGYLPLSPRRGQGWTIPGLKTGQDPRCITPTSIKLFGRFGPRWSSGIASLEAFCFPRVFRPPVAVSDDFSVLVGKRVVGVVVLVLGHGGSQWPGEVASVGRSRSGTTDTY